MQYVTKSGDYVTKGIDVSQYLEKRAKKENSKVAIAVEMINEGKSLEEIDKEIPTCVLQNKRKLEEYIAWKQVKKMKYSLVPWTLPVTNQRLKNSVELHPSQQICQWLKDNIRVERPFGQKQLYIWGKTALGKTHLILQLSKMLSIYHMPRTEKYLDTYEDGEYDLVVLDEFRGNKEITFMNSFLDGQHVTLPRKGSQYLKKVNVPVIILSNYDLEHAYRHVSEERREDLDPLYRRLTFVEVKERINILFNAVRLGPENNKDGGEVDSGSEGTEEADTGPDEGEQSNDGGDSRDLGESDDDVS